jgi:hypothetical protein
MKAFTIKGPDGLLFLHAIQNGNWTIQKSEGQSWLSFRAGSKHHQEYVDQGYACVEVTITESDAVAVPDGYKLIAVKDFGPLIAALERADRKGYMPDSCQEEWDAFRYDTLKAKGEPK